MNNQMNDQANAQARKAVSSVNQKPNQAAKGKIMPKSVKTDSKYTENWINVKAIRNGIIYNDTNEMVTGVKIQPKNIFILESSELDNILIGLMNLYNTLDFEFWIMVVDRPVDISTYHAELQLLLSKAQDQQIRKTIIQDMEKGDIFVTNDVVDTEYYLLFKEKRMELLQKKVRNLINGLAACGLAASHTTNDDLRTIIDNLLNGGVEFNSGTVIPE